MQTKQLSVIIIVILLAVVAFLVLNKPDNRNPIQKVGDAVHELPNGVDNAARELKDRTPGEKIKDEVKDATDGRE